MFSSVLFLFPGGRAQNGPGAVKGAPLLSAARRTLDGEDRSEIIEGQGKDGERCGCRNGLFSECHQHTR
jgi:hypothetical protein